MRVAERIEDVVTSGLCIGCGLCEAVSGGRAQMAMTPYGALRPTPADAFTPEEEATLLAACPGVAAEPRPTEPGAELDPVWGAHTRICEAWAGDPEVRFQAATGGVLTALGMDLVARGVAAFVLQTAPDPDAPMRSCWRFSRTPDSVRRAAGSRYGPTAPLAGIEAALAEDAPFAVIAKPCDLGAIHRLAARDPRVDRLCVARLAMVCGGQSRLTKSARLLEELGVDEAELTVFRHRGYGNPGRTRVETRDGRAYERTYQELWADEAGWDLETRCKLCPDALGEAADVAAADIWPGGTPEGEDAGINGIIVRSAAGERMVSEAVASGALALGATLSPRFLDDCQPHQVKKKTALAARLEGLAAAGFPGIATPGLRLDALGARLSPEMRAAEAAGTAERVRRGRVGEPAPRAGG